MDPNLDELLSEGTDSIDNTEHSTLSNSDDIGIDDVLAMSEEEIDQLLSAKKSGENSDQTIFAPTGKNFDELMDSMGEASQKGDLGVINDLLKKEQEEIPVDPSIARLLDNLDNSQLDFEDYSPEDLFDSTSAKKGKQKKAKKEGLFSKLFSKSDKSEDQKKKAAKKDKVKKQKSKKGKADKNVSDDVAKAKQKKDNTPLVADDTTVSSDVEGTVVQPDDYSSDFNMQDVEEFDIENLDDVQPDVRSVDDGDIQYQASDLFDHNSGDSDEQDTDADTQQTPDGENPLIVDVDQGVVQEFDADELDQLLEIRDKEDVPEEGADTVGEKKGLWAKIKDFLADDEEEEEEEAPKKDKKPKKNKKDAKKNEESEDGDEESSAKDDKKKKKEKKPKVKKAKAPKEEDTNAKKYPVKKMLLILLVFIAFGSAFALVSYMYMGHYTKQKGVAAYERGEYAECYQNLYGQHLTESQEIMFHKSEINLKMDLAKKNYIKFKTNGQTLKALDHIVQFFFRYDDTIADARNWNCAEVVQTTKDELEEAMLNDFGISIGKAKEIGNMESDYDYTRALLNIVNELDVSAPNTGHVEPDRSTEPGSDTDSYITED